jgi:hypothetical protein
MALPSFLWSGAQVKVLGEAAWTSLKLGVHNWARAQILHILLYVVALFPPPQILVFGLPARWLRKGVLVPNFSHTVQFCPFPHEM